jgi:ABC-type branched-subunit amino acid transport system substrate-binding protein
VLIAQDAPEVFLKARQDFHAGRYDSTITVIRNFLAAHTRDSAALYLVPLAQEAYARSDDMAPDKAWYDLYRQRFSTADGMPRVAYLFGYSQARRGAWLPALVAYSAALDYGASGELDSLVMAGALLVHRNAPDLSATSDSVARAPLNPRIRAVLAATPAPGTAEHAAAAEIVPTPTGAAANPAGGESGDEFIGLLVPLTGENADAGKRVAQGVQLAIEKHNTVHRVRLSIVPRDTKGSLIETVRATRELLGHDRLPAIIGPVLSPTATVTAGMLIGKETVMLTPTATDDGIASLGPNIFQMNITIGVLARSVARYALANLNIREFVILAPHTAIGAAMSAAFRDEVARNGGTVYDEETYDEGASDYTPLFVKLRKKLLIRTLDDRAKARGGDYRPVRSLSWADSVRFTDSSVATGAIFLPSDAEDLPALTSQIAFNRIRAQLLGSSGWRSPKTTVDENQYIANAIISAPFEPDASWRPWPSFARDYAARFHEDPDRVAALGFDAGTLVADAIDSAGSSEKPSRMQEILSTTRHCEGTSGLISFDPKTRDNSEASIYKLTSSGFIRVQ